MITAPACLANQHLAIGVIGIFVFYSFALICIGSWLNNKTKKNGLRVFSLLLLTTGGGLYAANITGSLGQIGTYSILIIGLVLLLLSFILFRRAPRPSSNLADAPVQPTKLPDINKKQAVEKSDTLIKKSATSPLEKTTDKITPQQRPATARQARAIIKTVATTQKPTANVGLRSNAFLKLPRRRKKGLVSFVNTLIGFTIFILIGWGAYVGYQKWFGSSGEQPYSFEESKFIEQYSNITPVPAAEPAQSDTEPATEEDGTADEEPAEATPAPASVTLTIKETETGTLNVRDGAGTIFEILTTISPGDTVELLDEDKNWYKIKVDDNTTGWISSRYADKNE